MGRRFAGIKGVDAFGKVRLLPPPSPSRRPGSRKQADTGLVLQTMEDVKIKTGFGGARASALSCLALPLLLEDGALTSGGGLSSLARTQ